MRHAIVGTAGHVDHGKTALIKALTGIDADRLRQEKERGMTIDLGFAPIVLPSGQVAGVVDVPGHERFIKNMLAGAHGVDVALLVVAANEGVMPQTLEHLDILQLLGVREGVVAITKADLAEDDEWLELVVEDVRETLAGTSLAEAPVIPVSARTGRGLDELVAAMDQAVGRAVLGGEEWSFDPDANRPRVCNTWPWHGCDGDSDGRQDQARRQAGASPFRQHGQGKAGPGS